MKGSVLLRWRRTAGLTVHSLAVLVPVPLWSTQHQSARGLAFVWTGDTLPMVPVVRKQYEIIVSESSSTLIFLYIWTLIHLYQHVSILKPNLNFTYIQLQGPANLYESFPFHRILHLWNSHCRWFYAFIFKACNVFHLIVVKL